MGVFVNREGLRQAGFRNLIQAGLLLVGMAAVLGACAWLIAGEAGIAATGVAVTAATLVVPRLGPATVMRLHRGAELPPWRVPELAAALKEIARRAGLAATPTLYWLPDRAVNAFAAGGPARAAIGLSDGAFRTLSLREMEAVLAHEVAHIATGDTGLLRLTELIAGATRFTALFGLTAGLLLALTGSAETVPVWTTLAFAAASPAVVLLQLAFARNREFAADLGAVALTGDPFGLISALERIEALGRRGWPWIVGGAARMLPPVLLRSHPPTRERVVRLLRQVQIASPAQDLLDSPAETSRIMTDGRRATAIGRSPFGRMHMGWRI